MIKQSKEYQRDIIEEDTMIVTLEAGSILSWQKYTRGKGINLGIDQFGESAPYKEIYDHFNLSEEFYYKFYSKKIKRVV